MSATTQAEPKSAAGESVGPGNNTVARPVAPGISSQPPAASAPVKRPNVFGLSGAVQWEDVPEGRFRNELSRLGATARRYALDKLGRLQVPLHDVASLSVDADGQLFYQCSPPQLPPPLVAADEPGEAGAELTGDEEKTVAAAEVPIELPPVRHSRPGATKVIYLDFNGHTITGTAWNGSQTTFAAKPFNTDSNAATFSDSEQDVIVKVWERVAEDYKGFDVDVTTEEPASFTANTGRILITDNVDANGVSMPSSGSAGVAYLDVFGAFNYVSRYSPALVYANQVSNREDYIAEVASHEMGHNLSLSHDGTQAVAGDNYYGGHGSGETSWNTIMGSASARNKTQWSKGDYYDADNFQDDLAVIASHLGYIPDDHTDSNATATPLTVNGVAVSGAGIISQTGEADRFSFESGGGGITISVSAFRSATRTHGGNLDVGLELYDAGGGLVASANVDGVTNATLNTTVSGGSYYLRVFGAGSGTPSSSSPTGYTNYGSLGQYTISGTVISTVPVAPSITSQPANQTVYAGQTAQFAFGTSGYPAPTYQWKKGGVNINGATGSTFSIASAVAGDAGSYTCVATNSMGSVTSNAAALTVNAATLPSFSTQPVSQAIMIGSPVTFTVVASGVPAPTYQWKKSGVNISGATGSSYTIGSVVAGSAGSYTVVATNVAGSVTSNAAVLTVTLVVAPSGAIISFTVE